MLSEKLRAERKKRSMTQTQLAQMTGLTTGYLSQLERGRLAPSFEALHKISAALEIPVSDLLYQAELRPVVLREGQQLKSPAFDGGQLELLTPLLGRDGVAMGVEVSRMTLPPGGWTGDAPRPYDWETCYYTTEGTVALHTSQQCLTLEAGDSAFLQRGTAHRLHNPGEEPGTVICVMRWPK